MLDVRCFRFILPLVVACALALTGCVSDRSEASRVAPYQPDMVQRDVAAWFQAGEQLASEHLSTNETTKVEPPDAATWSRVFRAGDRIVIALGGIPVPEERQYVVDDKGMVNMSFIGDVSIAGKTPSEAKRAITEAYIKGGIYRNINVSISASEEEFYVQGAVRNPGRHRWRPGITLTQAIIAAGGYNEFAKPGQVQLIRSEDKTVHDVNRIQSGRDRDPPIEPGDTIVVDRRWFL